MWVIVVSPWLSGSNIVEGEEALYPVNFNKGDTFKIYFPENLTHFTGTATASSNRVKVVTATAGIYTNGDAVVMTDTACSCSYVAEQRLLCKLQIVLRLLYTQHLQTQ